MKPLLPLLLLPWLVACASQGPTSAEAPSMAAETLALVNLDAHTVEVRLGGIPYQGTWQESRCFNPSCRGEFRNVLRADRRHVRKGEAHLVAGDGTPLYCEWVSYRRQARGTCETVDGRVYRLEAGNA